ncbi:MAG: hypothetical protein V1720_21490 [bacterium]
MNHLIKIFVKTILLSFNLFGQSNITIEFLTGVPYNAPLPLTINQNGEEQISLIARYRSEPFVIPIYWHWRIGYWNGDSGWELESTHHKIYLDNPPPEVQEFSISHGFNFVNINYAWKYNDFILRAGAGFVLAHAESTIRNKKLPEDGGIGGGYYLRGPLLNFAINKHFEIIERIFLSFELKATAAYSNVPVVDGDADVYVFALQANFGVGFIPVTF